MSTENFRKYFSKTDVTEEYVLSIVNKAHNYVKRYAKGAHQWGFFIIAEKTMKKSMTEKQFEKKFQGWFDNGIESERVSTIVLGYDAYSGLLGITEKDSCDSFFTMNSPEPHSDQNDKYNKKIIKQWLKIQNN